MQQIVKGVNAGETVAADGAGFLTEGAAVAIRGQGSEKGTAKGPREKGARKG
jgi:hypothetical protein